MNLTVYYPPCAFGDELVAKMSKLTIKGIPIEDDLQINWQVGYSSNDYAYLKYGKFEELILSSEYNNDYVSYEELYCIDE